LNLKGNRIVKQLSILALMTLSAINVFPARLAAQPPATKSGTVEVGPYFGGTFDLPGASGFAGICSTQSTNDCNQKFQPGHKSQPTFGTDLAISLFRGFWVYGDYAYMYPDKTAANAQLGNSIGVTTTNRHYWSAGGGLRLMYPRVQRVNPYVEVGLVNLYQNYNTTSSYTNVVGGTGPDSTLYRTHGAVGGIWGPHIGGGVRLFPWGPRQGFRISVDGYYLSRAVEQEAAGATPGDFPTVTRKGYGRVTVGYFFRFGR
jgi:hypothetical protein